MPELCDDCWDQVTTLREENGTVASEMEGAILITASLITKRLQEGNFKTVEEIVGAAMKAAQDNSNSWMLASDDDRMKAAIVAAHPMLSEVDQARMKRELDFFQALSAASAGVPVDFERLLEDGGEEIKPIGLRKLWEEAAGGAKKVSGKDSAGLSIGIGSKVKFRGEVYTVKAFRPGEKDTSNIEFEEEQHIKEVANETSVDRVV